MGLKEHSFHGLGPGADRLEGWKIAVQNSVGLYKVGLRGSVGLKVDRVSGLRC